MNYEDHYKILLELDENWGVDSIDFDHRKETVVVKVSFKPTNYYDSSFDKHFQIYDHRKSRQWRHLDTLQYKTYIEAQVPRITDQSGKVSTLNVPWADSAQRHTYLLEKK